MRYGLGCVHLQRSGGRQQNWGLRGLGACGTAGLPRWIDGPRGLRVRVRVRVEAAARQCKSDLTKPARGVRWKEPHRKSGHRQSGATLKSGPTQDASWLATGLCFSDLAQQCVAALHKLTTTSQDNFLKAAWGCRARIPCDWPIDAQGWLKAIVWGIWSRVKYGGWEWEWLRLTSVGWAYSRVPRRAWLAAAGLVWNLTGCSKLRL